MRHSLTIQEAKEEGEEEGSERHQEYDYVLI